MKHDSVEYLRSLDFTETECSILEESIKRMINDTILGIDNLSSRNEAELSPLELRTLTNHIVSDIVKMLKG